MSSTSPSFLTTLPPEIHLLTISHLRFLDRYTFRLTCPHLYTPIPAPTFKTLKKTRDSEFPATAIVALPSLQLV